MRPFQVGLVIPNDSTAGFGTSSLWIGVLICGHFFFSLQNISSMYVRECWYSVGSFATSSSGTITFVLLVVYPIGIPLRNVLTCASLVTSFDANRAYHLYFVCLHTSWSSLQFSRQAMHNPCRGSAINHNNPS